MAPVETTARRASAGVLRRRWITAGLTLLLLAIVILVDRTSLGDGPLGILFGIGVLRFTLRAAVPLIFGALSGILCERSGIINIGIEGMMLAGAFGAFAVKSHTGQLPLPLSLALSTLSACAMGSAMGYLHALLSIRFRMNQIISGTAIIVLATGLSTYLFDPDWLSRGKFSDIAIPVLARIPVIGEVLFTNGLLTYLALAMAIALHFLLFRSRWGLRTRAIGEHPRAADTMGVNVNRWRYINTTIGGAVAALGGAFLVLEAVGQFKESMTAGRGFISLAAMIFGNWSPLGALGASTLFGYTQALQNQLLLSGITRVPRFFISMLPYVTTIVVLASVVGRTRAPAAEGEVYETE
ncbi:MAG: ABC transporter permease [Chloroflexi bacterium]|nr:ABC transporter permease [Chloroflexota bacterium]